MGKRKRKLTKAEKAEKKRRRKEYMTVFVRGKQKRVRRPPTIEGMDVDEFILRNADPIWLHQNEMWENMEWPDEQSPVRSDTPRSESDSGTEQFDCEKDDDIPF